MRSSVHSSLIPLLALSSALHAQRPVPLLVSTDWLAKHLRDPGVVVIHASQQKTDYDAGHVPGARFLPWQAYTVQRDGLSTELPDAGLVDSALEGIGVSDGSHIVITGGPITITARLYYTLDYFGLGAHISLLDGGIDAWREEGRPIDRAASPAASRGTVSLHAQPAKFADASRIVSGTAAPGNHLDVLDARVPEFYAGLAVNNTPRAGRLPMAQNVPFSWLTGELTRFRDRSKLERLFAQAGVKKGDTVVTYCHIGQQASVLYVAARILGFDAAVYDGSFEDWSRRSELPVGGPGAGRPPQR
jgi:thiosulfate/3-mercaptopyruvate sulfurtransferase